MEDTWGQEKEQQDKRRNTTAGKGTARKKMYSETEDFSVMTGKGVMTK